MPLLQRDLLKFTSLSSVEKPRDCHDISFAHFPLVGESLRQFYLCYFR